MAFPVQRYSKRVKWQKKLVFLCISECSLSYSKIVQPILFKAFVAILVDASWQLARRAEFQKTEENIAVFLFIWMIIITFTAERIYFAWRNTRKYSRPNEKNRKEQKEHRNTRRAFALHDCRGERKACAVYRRLHYRWCLGQQQGVEHTVWPAQP